MGRDVRKESFRRHLPSERLAAFVETHRAVHARRLADYEAQHAAAKAAVWTPIPQAVSRTDAGECGE